MKSLRFGTKSLCGPFTPMYHVSTKFHTAMRSIPNVQYLVHFLLVCLAGVLTAQAQPTIEWDRTLGGSGLDRINSLQQTADGGYILGGESFSDADIAGGKSDKSRGFADYWVVKLDANGNKQWDKTLGGNGLDGINSL
ncbi:MAG: hypothetical protein ACK50T_08995, partial [Sphingobacteriia bacterium]